MGVSNSEYRAKKGNSYYASSGKSSVMYSPELVMSVYLYLIYLTVDTDNQYMHITLQRHCSNIIWDIHLQYIHIVQWQVECSHFEMPIQSKCKKYSPSEFNLEYISNFAFEELGSAPLPVQLEATTMVRNGSLRLLRTRSGAPAFSSLCNHLRGVVDGMASRVAFQHVLSYFLSRSIIGVWNCQVLGYGKVLPVYLCSISGNHTVHFHFHKSDVSYLLHHPLLGSRLSPKETV